MFYRLLSILFLLTIFSVSWAARLKAKAGQAGFGYFIMRNEYDDRCVAYINGVIQLTTNCNAGEAVWEGEKGKVINIAIKNYFTGKYLSFTPGVQSPVMNAISPNNNNARWTYQFVHQRSRRWPANPKYFGVSYYVVNNVGTRLCLMVNGNLMLQKGCNPSLPEHISFEEVPFNKDWKKSPERIKEETKTPPPPTPPTPVTPVTPKPKPGCPPKAK